MIPVSPRWAIRVMVTLTVFLFTLFTWPILIAHASGPIVTGTDPMTHTVVAPLNTNQTITFSQNISASTVSHTSIAVHGSLSGRLTGTYTTMGNVVSFDPSRNLWPGELVEVSVVDSLQSPGGNAVPKVWQFTGQAGVGPATFYSHLAHELPSSGGSANNLVVGDVDGDGDLDIAAALSNQVKLYQNNGDGSFVAGQQLSVGGWSYVAFGDVDGDGDLDLAIAASSSLYMYRNNGTGIFGSVQNLGGIGSPSDVVFGDVDRDGDLDLVIGNASSQANKLYLNSGSGSFGSGQNITSDAYNTWSVALGDVDGDGDLDLVAGNAPGDDRLYLNNGMVVLPQAKMSLTIVAIRWM